MRVNWAGRLPWNQSRPPSRSNPHQRWGHAQLVNFVPFAEREQTEIGGSAAPPYLPPPKVLADVLSPAIDIPHIEAKLRYILRPSAENASGRPRVVSSGTPYHHLAEAEAWRDMATRPMARQHSAPCAPLFRARPLAGLKPTLKSDAASCERAGGTSKASTFRRKPQASVIYFASSTF